MSAVVRFRRGDRVRLTDEEGRTLGIAEVKGHRHHPVSDVRGNCDLRCGGDANLNPANHDPCDFRGRGEEGFELGVTIRGHHESASVDVNVSVGVGVVDVHFGAHKNSCSVVDGAGNTVPRTTVQASVVSDAADTRAGAVFTPVPAPARDVTITTIIKERAA